jgi:DNA repair exonuclease SbcCD nuclease subunit
VIHGGDLYFRSKIPASLVEMAIAPLKRIAEKGIKVYLVPGNHERSRFPWHLWAKHPNIHIFDRPRTYLHFTESNSLALAGFPYCRNIRDKFNDLLNLTCYNLVNADAKLLCIHQVVEGAQAGRNYELYISVWD